MQKKNFLHNVSDILKVLRLYFGGIVVVGIMYFLFTGIDQGIDVVIQAGEQVSAAILSVAAVVLCAYLLWYSCRLLSYTKQCAEADVSTKLLQLLPRLLAYNCFVCVQVAIFALPTFCNLSFWQILAFIVVQNAFYYILHQWLAHKKSFARWTGIVFIAAMLVYYGYLAAQSINVPRSDIHKLMLPFVGAALFILQVLVVYYFIRRRENIDKEVATGTAPAAPASGRLAKSMNSRYAPYEGRQIKLFSGVSAIAVVIYCIAIFSIVAANGMGPMAFVMLGLGVLVGFSNLVSYFGIRLQINLFLFIFIIAVILGKFSDPYKVRNIYPVGPSFYASRPSIKTYLYLWAKKREALLDKYDSTKKFPVYLVLSDGGASRAGNWVCSVLSSLQDSSVAKDPNDPFSDHLLAIAGASGGSVGNATFYGMLRSRQQGLLNGPFSPHAKTFFDGDFLTFTLARLLGPDIFRHIIPIRSIMDRGAALESVLATGTSDAVIDTQLNRPLSAVFDTSGSLPVFFITTTRVQDGMPSILGSTQLPTRSQRADVTKLLDSIHSDIRFATAAILSSRFPYLSPAGGIHDNYFVDGGYVDNAGAGIMLDFLQELEQIATTRPDSMNDTTRLFMKFKDRITLHAIHIYNSPESEMVFNAIRPLANDMVTPLLTLAGMQGSSTLIYTGSFMQNFQAFNSDTTNAIINYSLYVPGEEEESYPMSWVISDYQLNRMHTRLVKANQENLKKFWFAGK